MKAIRLVIILFVFTMFSCKKEEKDTTFKIYHLKHNKVYENTDTLRSFGRYSKKRSDFFVVKNFNKNNEQHKIKIDNFVLNRLKKDSFLIKNKNSKWSLTFFKYGNGIDENTKHQYGTDYAIHTLFSYKKELGSFHFNNRFGYSGSSFRITSEKLNTDKRKIISDYFDSIAILNPNLDKMMKVTLKHLGINNEETIKKDTIKVLVKFIEKGIKNSIKIVQYKVLKSLEGSMKIKGDTINIAYSNTYKPEKMSENNKLTLLRYKLKFNSKYYYVFQDDADVNLSIPTK